jgi:hypothetical protein
VNLVLQERAAPGGPYAVLQAEIAGLVVTPRAQGSMPRPIGIMAAAIASLAGYLTVNAVLLINTKRHFGISLGQLLLRRGRPNLGGSFERLISAAGDSRLTASRGNQDLQSEILAFPGVTL